VFDCAVGIQGLFDPLVINDLGGGVPMDLFDLVGGYIEERKKKRREQFIRESLLYIVNLQT
jgi:hypothetical protein